MFYTGRRFWRRQACDRSDFADRPLWVAHYGEGEPNLFGGWQGYRYWQFAASSPFLDVEGNFDLDRLSGSTVDLERLRR